MKAQWSASEELEAESAMVTAVALCPAWRVASGSSVERHHGLPMERVLGTSILCTLVSARTSTGSMATSKVNDQKA